MEKKIHDNELGCITLRSSRRATRYTLKITNGEITAVFPEGGDEEHMLQFIHDNREKIRQALTKHPRKERLSDTTQLQTTTFRLHIFRTERQNFYMRLENGILHIACPMETCFDDDEVQKLLKGLIEKALRHEAKRLLPQRLTDLARKYHFNCTGVKINNSRGHWGSCTSRKSINLSLYLMLLPWHLIDYVLLHELCHTIEMNHGERFWQQMDKVTDKKARLLRSELQNYLII